MGVVSFLHRISLLKFSSVSLCRLFLLSFLNSCSFPAGFLGCTFNGYLSSRQATFLISLKTKSKQLFPGRGVTPPSLFCPLPISLWFSSITFLMSIISGRTVVVTSKLGQSSVFFITKEDKRKKSEVKLARNHWFIL